MIGLKYTNLNGKKYQLAEGQMIFIPEFIDICISHLPFVSIKKGWLLVMAGYMWNGANGVPDNPDNMRASLFHDALYELMQLGLLDRIYRDVADRLLQRVCMEDGMKKEWAKRFYDVVHALGESASFPSKHVANIIIEI